jgi:recombination protein RecT
MNQVAERVPNEAQVLRHELQNMEGQFKAALPAHIPVERFARVVMTALQNNPDLVRKCDRRSLWNSAMRAAQDGLLPDGREGAIVAYGSQAQWMPMIAGIRKKVRNSGEIATWDAQVVRAKDIFKYQLGDDPFIQHEPSLDADPGAVVAAYSIAVLKSGEKSREVMSVAAIEKVRGRSKAKNNGPWVSDYEEMCRKTVARRHSKLLPMSTDLDDLIRRDDDLYDIKGAGDEAQPERKKTIAGRLDALAALPTSVDTARITGPDHDPETGEIDQTEQAPAAVPPKTAPAAVGAPSIERQAPPASPVPGGGGQPDIPPALDRRKKAAPPDAPKSAAEYDVYAQAWIASLIDPQSTRWVDEIDMRNKLNLPSEVRERLRAMFEEKIAQLMAQG